MTVTVLPKLLNDAIVSSGSPSEAGRLKPPGSPSVSASAATQMTVGALAGEKVLASTAELPAAAHIVTPAAVQLSTAALMAADGGPPKLMLATLTWVAFWCTKSSA